MSIRGEFRERAVKKKGIKFGGTRKWVLKTGSSGSTMRGKKGS